MNRFKTRILSLLLVLCMTLSLLPGTAFAAVGDLLSNTSAQNESLLQQLESFTGESYEEVYDLLERQGVNLVDATCPFVKKIHRIAQKEEANGRRILIIGNAKHPEVEGIRGWCKAPSYVVESPEEAENLRIPAGEKLCIVSQTTFNYNKFEDIVEIISKKGYDIIVLNTICSATEERQTEAREIAADVDAMIVIGGRHSSNTQKLFEICKKECENTYYIQSLDDLDLKTSQSIRCVGITAGASTPNKIIEEVQKHVRIKF